MQRARLLYHRRLLVKGPNTLLALLHFRDKRQLSEDPAVPVDGPVRQPWTKLVFGDVHTIRTRVIGEHCLPDPDDDPSAWSSFICAAGG